MREIVAVDIGGTHARFAIATIEDGKVVSLGEATTLKCAEHGSLALAWETFGRSLNRTLPREAGIAVACPVSGEILKLTNNPWIIQPSQLGARLHLDNFVLVNDFGAVAHAVAQVDSSHMKHLCGPDIDLPTEGAITIVGPGTGLGAACLLRRSDRYFVMETEGGHLDYPPLDELEDKILSALRLRFRRVSAERIVSGPGLTNLYEVIAEMQGWPITLRDNRTLWKNALDGSDTVAVAALERFCLSLGAISGDLALAHGARGVVIGGGLGLRLADSLGHSGFAERFVAKGRFEAMMTEMPVKIITHPQPGLFGAAAAYAEAHP
ncbi:MULTISPECIES: glucokinase [Gluconobacter]|uniref:Glucokinase n=4 Tax=Gluconobacter oxydans TaxID=442 RepID=Q5FN97_GLUOX|nr:MULTISPECIES: glucokinase [Gluconobacter]AAW62150.1 Glucokinase [Gluconobacter oxydans 621H]AHK72385.1 glucokinase Glk [Gluconobacter oxydans DSM 3504]KXV08884.1 glucokinase [Gluconobacter oxydans]KXV30924.1 glucokinase [Gluconobacter oxydans]KXV64896.1 glucokinase [Gluconobacter oxydans]